MDHVKTTLLLATLKFGVIQAEKKSLEPSWYLNIIILEVALNIIILEVALHVMI